jgi:hypothetical protein
MVRGAVWPPTVARKETSRRASKSWTLRTTTADPRRGYVRTTGQSSKPASTSGSFRSVSSTYLDRPYQGCRYTLLALSTYLPRHAGTRFSNGWLEKFKRRHGISEHTRHGGASSVDEALSAEQLVAVQAIAAQFHASNTYNCDESGLSWKTVPDKGQATEAIAGTKHEKARITAHSCCNADGSHKLPIWFIGKHQKPRCFGAANINLNSLGCY